MGLVLGLVACAHESAAPTTAVRVRALSLRPLAAIRTGTVAQTCAQHVALTPQVVFWQLRPGVWFDEASAGRLDFVLGTCLPLYERLAAAERARADDSLSVVRTATLGWSLATQSADSWHRAYASLSLHMTVSIIAAVVAGVITGSILTWRH